MIWKTILVTFLAVDVLAEYTITDEYHQQYKNMTKEVCTQKIAEDQVEDVEGTIRNFVDCIEGIFDVETIKNEIEYAKSRDALHEVFKNYCAKSPQTKTCLHTFIAGISPCIEPTVREQIDTANNTIDQFIDFVCYKDGDRIALFFAENGPECFKDKSPAILECVTRIGGNITSVADVKALTLTEQCSQYDELTACIMKALEECSTPTPSNLAESLFRVIRKNSLCNLFYFILMK